jgi:hypothetical protein
MTPRPRPRVAVEQRGQLFGHRTGQLLGIGDRDRAVVIARHVMADADGQKLHRLALSTMAITSRRCFSR